MIRLAVLLSGSGTTLQNFIDRIAARQLDAQIEVVVSSRPSAVGLDRARAAGLPAVAVDRRALASVDAFNDALHEALRRHAPDLVLLAGFLSPFQLRSTYAGRVMNVHPALIPAFCGQGFYGRRVHEAVLAAGVRVSGCTVHFADDEYDHGPIILQRVVPVLDDDTPDTLAARVHVAELEAYPEAVRLFAEKRLDVVDRRVRIRW